MSYINDALRKAQKEKESGYHGYGSIIGAADHEERRDSRAILYTGLLAVILVIAGGIFYLYGLMNERKLVAVRTPAVMAQQQAVQPVITPLAELPEAVKLDTGVSGKSAEPVKKKLSAQEVQALFDRAVVKQNEGKIAEAREMYLKVIANSRSPVRAKNNLGVIYMTQKDYRAAEKLFKEALALKPKYVDVHYNLACLYAQRKEYARSLFYLKTAIGINPEVRNWARNDKDLKNLSNYPDFDNLMEGRSN